MAFKLFLFSLIMIFSVVFLTKKILKNTKFLGMEKLLNQASEDQKIRFYETSFKSFDANKDGFVTSDEFDNVDLGALPLNSFIMETMTEASIQFEQEHESCTFLSLSTELLLDQCYVIPCNEIGITFEDYKDVLKMKLEQIFRKKN